MIRKPVLILMAVATLLMVGSPGASAASASRSCDSNGGSREQGHTYEWTGFTDGDGDIRLRWTNAIINNLAGGGTEYRLVLTSTAGVHFDTGVVNTPGVNYINWNGSIPSSANAKTKWHPVMRIESGALNDGRARCYTTVAKW
jgi:hypothetical protein